MAFETLPLDAVGVEIRDAQLGGLGADGLARLRELVLAHGLVRLRDQRLSEEEQIALGRRFGRLEQLVATPAEGETIAAIANVDSRGEVMPLDHPAMRSIQVNERWHTDSSFREVPASFSIFRAVEVPERGGDTFYASLRRGWQELAPELRRDVRGRRAVHDYQEALRRLGAPIPYWARDAAEPVAHPLVRRHPETGEAGLYVSEHAFSVEGMEPRAGLALIERLVAHCTAPGRVYRHRWRVGDVLIWDNRQMLHRAQGFDGRSRRVMHHVRVAGTEPVVAADA